MRILQLQNGLDIATYSTFTRVESAKMVPESITEFEGGEEASRECPVCHSNRFWKDGTRKTGKSAIQRFFCRDCGHRFSESSVLSTRLVDNGGRQVCAILTEEAKNLAEVEPKNRSAGATEQIVDENRDAVPRFENI